MVTRTTGKRKVVKNTFSQDLIDTVFEREVRNKTGTEEF